MATIAQSTPQFLPQATPTCPDPAWEVALLFPSQGNWTEEDYFALDTNRLVELVDGKLEVLPMPTISHQFIVSFLNDALGNYLKSRRLGQGVLRAIANAHSAQYDSRA